MSIKIILIIVVLHLGTMVQIIGQDTLDLVTFKAFSKTYGYLVHFCPECDIEDRFQFGLTSILKLQSNKENLSLSDLFSQVFCENHEAIVFSIDSIKRNDYRGKFLPISHGMPFTNILTNSKKEKKQIERYIGKIYYQENKSAKGLAFDNHVLTRPISKKLYLTWPRTSKSRKSHTNIPKLNNYDLNKIEVRLLAVAELWNIFQHFSPHHDNFQVKWDSVLVMGYDIATKSTNKEEFLSGLSSLLSLTNDAHVKWKTINHSNKKYYPDIEIEPFQERWIVVRGSGNVKTGDEIIGINNIELSIVQDSLSKLFSSPSSQYSKFKLIELALRGKKENSLKFLLQRQDSLVQLEVPRVVRKMPSYCNRTLKKRFDDDFLYLNLNELEHEQLNHLLKKELSESKGLILDLRDYPKTDLFSLISHLTCEKMLGDHFVIPQISLPNREDMLLAIETAPRWEIRPKCLKSLPIVVLSSGRAFSAAESFMALMAKQKNFTIIGEETAGTNGNQNFFILPGGIEISFTGMLVYSEKLERTIMGKGIKPDIQVPIDLVELKKGKDIVLLHAIDLLKKN